MHVASPLLPDPFLRYLESTNENRRNQHPKILPLLHLHLTISPTSLLLPPCHTNFAPALPPHHHPTPQILKALIREAKPMASTTFFAAAPGFTATVPRQSQAAHQPFFGLRTMKPADRVFAAARQGQAWSKKISSSGGGGKVGVVGVRAELNTSLVISLSTGLSLFLGRFVFFNFQRENVAKQVPEQNGVTHFEAGDTRAKEYVGLLKSNDPVGFNIVDVLAWGSIGHIVAYYILATSSNGYDPSFFP